MTLRMLTYHDRQDAEQDAWVAALEKGRTDHAYLAGCKRICAIEIMRQNDRRRAASSDWSTVYAPSSVFKGTRVRSDATDHLLPFDVMRTTAVLHGEDYREKLRRQERERRARRGRA